MNPVEPVTVAQIGAAQARLASLPMCSTLLRTSTPAGASLALKLENLQPVGSFKIRPIGSVLLARPRTALERGIWTASSGNSAVGVAWLARRLGLAATALVPLDAPAVKLERLRNLGARIDIQPVCDWWRAIETGTAPGQQGLYVDAVRDPDALAGDGTIGLEVLQQVPDVEAILVPFGGGGLASGIACAVRALNPRVRIVVCELASAQPLAAARRAGHPVQVPHEAGFVSGVGYGTVLPEMWPLVNSVIDDVTTVSLAEVAAAIRWMLQEHRVVAEGAGAVAVAAALSGRLPYRRMCAIVSGGNLDTAVLTAILDGKSY
ncbi:MAG: pyridoxal-phosphate dependent enzyme [Proteobacteria bacterium]|nr:pyridoxal-phosphate dependent enzyme [Pseudomonadota bacterium]